MQERRHVKTTPGEPHAVPEFTPHPVRKQEGQNVQMDDINIPLVAVIVAFFAILLAVIIVSLQAWFYNYQAHERQTKTLAQDDPGTELGQVLQTQTDDLTGTGLARAPVATSKPAPGATQEARKMRIPIETAMQIKVKDYAAAQGAAR